MYCTVEKASNSYTVPVSVVVPSLLRCSEIGNTCEDPLVPSRLLVVTLVSVPPTLSIAHPCIRVFLKWKVHHGLTVGNFSGQKSSLVDDGWTTQKTEQVLDDHNSIGTAK